MDEAVVTQVDGYVIDPTALDVEEDQVAGLQITLGHLHPVALGHGIGGARQVDVSDVVEGVFDQPAAVKAFFRAAAAPNIRGTEHIYRTAEHVAALLRRHGGDIGTAAADGVAWAGAQRGLLGGCVFHRRVGRVAGETIGKTLLTIGGVGGQGQ